jgi:hypothetical protein
MQNAENTDTKSLDSITRINLKFIKLIGFSNWLNYVEFRQAFFYKQLNLEFCFFCDVSLRTRINKLKSAQKSMN